jgi:hypothetical protein
MTTKRWTSRLPTDETTDDESRAGLLLRRAIVKQPIDASALASIHSQLSNDRAPDPRRLVLRVSLAILLFLSGGGVVMSATLLGHWSPFSRPKLAPAVVEPLRRHDVPVHNLRTALEPRAAQPPPARPIAAPSAPHRSTISAAPAEPEPAPSAPTPAPLASAPSAIAEESALLGAALRKLREHNDPAGALALLDEHDGRFAANGALLDEASTTRIEALLRLGRRGPALALLEARTLSPVGHGRELLASRGELRADEGRCAEAILDFDALLTDDTAGDDAAERALYDRAACRARAGGNASARADLEAYVARFPSGRFADRARATLAH